MIKKHLFNATIINIFVKFLNYIYYLLVTIFIGYGIQTDSVLFIEGIVSFTLLLPMQILTFTLIPKLVKNMKLFNLYFSTMFYIIFTWSLLWMCVFYFYLSNIVFLFYPGLGNEYLSFLIENKIYLLIYISFLFLNRFMSLVLDAIQKHTTVYKILAIKSISSLFILYIFHNEKNILFLVLAYTIVIEFFSYIYIYKNNFILKSKIAFFVQQLKDIKYILLFASTGILYGVIDRYFISYLDDGSISILRYATLIIGMISGLVPITRILYPYVAKSDNKTQLDYFYKATKVILVVYIPILLFVYIFPSFLPNILFGYGDVTNTQIKQMGTLLLFLVPIAIIGLSAGILDKILYLQKLYKALYLRLIATFVINGIGNYLSVFIFDFGLNGIVFCTMLVHIYIIYSSHKIIKNNVNVG